MPTFEPTFEADLNQAGKYDVKEAALGTLQAKYIVPANPPLNYNAQTNQWEQTQFVMPMDLTQLSDDQLGQKLGEITAYSNWLSEQIPGYEADTNTAKEQLGMVESKLYIIYKTDQHGKKVTEQERKSRMRIDQRYIDAKARELYCETCFKYVRKIAESMERNYAAVSRRISQRQQDVERDRRGGNVGGAVPPPPVFRRPGM